MAVHLFVLGFKAASLLFRNLANIIAATALLASLPRRFAHR